MRGVVADPAVNKLGSLPVMLAGSDEIRKKYLTKLAAGEGGFSYCRRSRTPVPTPPR